MKWIVAIVAGLLAALAVGVWRLWVRVKTESNEARNWRVLDQVAWTAQQSINRHHSTRIAMVETDEIDDHFAGFRRGKGRPN